MLRSSGWRWAVVAVAVACLALAGACQSRPAPPAEDASGSTPAELDPEHIARLQALGYLDLGEPLDPDTPVGVLSVDRERAAGGLNFFTNSHFCSAQLMDLDGKIVHEWSHEPCFRWGNAVLLPNGDIIVMGRVPHDEDPQGSWKAHYVMRQNWDGEVLWCCFPAAPCGESARVKK